MQYLWEQKDGCSKAIGTYIWYIYIGQTVTKYLSKLSVELCARTKNKI